MERMTPTPDSSSPVPRKAPDEEQDAGPGPNSALTTLTNHLITSGMLTCAAIGVVQLGQQVSPTWKAGYVPLLCFCVALEAAYMTRYIRHGRLPAPWYVLRGVEVVVIFLMLRALLGLLRGPQVIPDSSVEKLDIELLGLAGLLLLIWLASWRLTSDLLDLETLDPGLDREIIHEVAQAQVEVRHGLIMFTVLIGVAITLLAGLLRMQRAATHQPDEGAWRDLGHVVVYFFLALVLYSRTRLNLLRSGWVWEKVPIGRSVGARWITYTMLLLFGAVVVALLLPTRYSLGLLGTLSYLLNFVIALVQTIFYAIVAVILNLLSRLIPDLPPGPPPPSMDSFPRLQADIPPPSAADFIQSLIFWTIFMAVAIYVVIQFLRQHPGLREWLAQLPGMPLFIRLWRRLRTWFGGLGEQILNLREARRRPRQPAPARLASTPRRLINLRKLSPRQQVQFYYLAMLRRGGEHGHARQPTQTPYEYARALERQLPEIDQDVDGITQEFIEARYSRHDIPLEQVGIVRRYWERIKRALGR